MAAEAEELELAVVAFHLFFDLFRATAQKDDAGVNCQRSEGDQGKLRQVLFEAELQVKDAVEERRKDSNVEGQQQGQAGFAGQAGLVEGDTVGEEQEVDEQDGEAEAEDELNEELGGVPAGHSQCEDQGGSDGRSKAEDPAAGSRGAGAR